MAKAKKYLMTEYELKAFVKINGLRGRYLTLPEFREKINKLVKELKRKDKQNG